MSSGMFLSYGESPKLTDFDLQSGASVGDAPGDLGKREGLLKCDKCPSWYRGFDEVKCQKCGKGWKRNG